MLVGTHMTMAEFVDLVEQNPDRHFKFTLDGEVIEVAPKLLYGWIQTRIASEFDTWLQSGALPGYGAVTEVAHEINGWPSRPDVAIVRMDSGPIPMIAPLVAVEIKSDSNTYTELREKAARYISLGSQLVWLVYPEKRIIEVFQTGAVDIQLLTLEDTFANNTVLPGFSVAISALFPKMG